MAASSSAASDDESAAEEPLRDELPPPPPRVTVLCDAEEEAGALTISALAPWNAERPDYEMIITLPHRNSIYKQLGSEADQPAAGRRGWAHTLLLARARFETYALPSHSRLAHV